MVYSFPLLPRNKQHAYTLRYRLSHKRGKSYHFTWTFRLKNSFICDILKILLRVQIAILTFFSLRQILQNTQTVPQTKREVSL